MIALSWPFNVVISLFINILASLYDLSMLLIIAFKSSVLFLIASFSFLTSSSSFFSRASMASWSLASAFSHVLCKLEILLESSVFKSVILLLIKVSAAL